MSAFELFSDSDEEIKQRRSLDVLPRRSFDTETQKNCSGGVDTNKLTKSNTKSNSKSRRVVSENDGSDDDNKMDDNSNYIKLKSLNELTNVGLNSRIYYTNHKGERISPKYFKSYDVITKVLTLGIRTDDSKTYECDSSRITDVYVEPTKMGGGMETHDDKLKDTIKISNSEWDKLVPDTVISYQRKDKKMVYKSKFNAFITKPGKGTRMSMTSITGFNYTVDPSYLETIYRHFTSKDKTMAQILQRLNMLEKKVAHLENQLHKK